MNFKLDENFGTRTQNVFEKAGHDIATVQGEALQGVSDQHLFRVCCEEQRCLVTFDLDFADVTRFPPEKAGGIVVIRVPKNPSLGLLERLVRQFLQAAEHETLERHLWIVEVDRIRVHQGDVDASS
jgi:predicted nuclease of predicted toxin-antitoxin system